MRLEAVSALMELKLEPLWRKGFGQKLSQIRHL
jgi:hypothetical protein